MKEDESKHPLLHGTCPSDDPIDSYHPVLIGQIQSTAVNTKNSSVFFDATKQGDVAVINQCLVEGVNPNARSLENETALHLAVKHHQPVIIRILIERGASYKLRNADGFTARDIATGDIEIALNEAISAFKQQRFEQRLNRHPLLLQLKAQVKRQQTVIDTFHMMDKHSFFEGKKSPQADSGTITQRQNQFVAACAQGDIVRMQAFIMQPVQLDIPDEHGGYPLLACLKSLQMDAIRYLGDQIEQQGSQAWQLIDLSVLEAQLNTMRPRPLGKSAGEAPNNHATWADLYLSYQANQAKCTRAYEVKYGSSSYTQGMSLASRTGTVKGAHLCHCRRARMLQESVTRMEWTIQYVNAQIDAVLSYSKEQAATTLFKPGT